MPPENAGTDNFVEINVPNEAKRLLKAKGKHFPTTIKAKRYLKTKELFLSSQEVIDAKQFTFEREDQKTWCYLRVNGVSARSTIWQASLCTLGLLLGSLAIPQGICTKPNVPNEAVNLLKTKVDAFLTGLKAVNLAEKKGVL